MVLNEYDDDDVYVSYLLPVKAYRTPLISHKNLRPRGRVFARGEDVFSAPGGFISGKSPPPATLFRPNLRPWGGLLGGGHISPHRRARRVGGRAADCTAGQYGYVPFGDILSLN